MAVKKHSPKMVIMTITGVGIVVGYAAGTMIEIARDNDTFVKEKGAQGDTVRIDSCDRGGKITFFLQRQSPTNALLEALALVDERTGLGVVGVSITDLNTLEVISAGEGWLLKPADWSASGGEAGVREWVLDCAEVTF